MKFPTGHSPPLAAFALNALRTKADWFDLGSRFFSPQKKPLGGEVRHNDAFPPNFPHYESTTFFRS